MTNDSDAKELEKLGCALPMVGVAMPIVSLVFPFIYPGATYDNGYLFGLIWLLVIVGIFVSLVLRMSEAISGWFMALLIVANLVCGVMHFAIAGSMVPT